LGTSLGSVLQDAKERQNFPSCPEKKVRANLRGVRVPLEVNLHSRIGEKPGGKLGVRERGEGVKEDSSFHLRSPGKAVTTPMVSILLECGSPSVLLNIKGKIRRLILDTGSKVSIVQPGVSRSGRSVTNLKPYGVIGEALDIKGRQSVSFELDGREFRHTFLVCEVPADTAVLLGTDFIQETGAVVDFDCGKMSLTGIGAVPRAYSGSPTGHTVLTVFTQGKEGHNPQPNQKEAWQVDVQLSASSKRETKASQDRSWFVRARQDIILATRCRQVVTARLESEMEQKLPSLVCIEPAQIPIEGIFPARALSRVGHIVRQSRERTSQQDREVVRSADSAYVMLANFSNEPMTIPKSTILGVAEEVSESLIDGINANAESSMNTPTKPPRKKKIKNL